VYGREQVSSSSVTTVVAESSPQFSSLAAAPYQQQLASQQPPAAATETAAAQGLTLALTDHRPTRRAQLLSARTSSSFRLLSLPILSPAYVIEQSQSVPVRTGRAASSQRLASQRATSQRAPSLSPSQSTYSYGAPSPPVGSDIEVQYTAARPFAFQPMPLGASSDVDTSANVDRARPVAAGVDVGRISLPYVDVSVVDARRPGSAAGTRLLESATSAFVGVPSAAVAQPGSLDAASARTHTRSDTPIFVE